MSRVLPILFNTEMVRAILREVSPKTATRRAIKGYIPDDAIWGYTEFTPKGCISCRGTFADGYGEKFFKLPCQKDDILYVRETWNFVYNLDEGDKILEDTGRYVYYADDSMPFSYWVDPDTGEHKDTMPWHPSIHMPKEAARIWLKVTGVRVERLQDITNDQILKEGISKETVNHYMMQFHEATEQWIRAAHFLPFSDLWNSTIKKDFDLYSWNANPWVWVIEFERCEKPAPCILKGMEPASDKRPCIGYQKSQDDDEPCEMCKGCKWCDGEELENQS